jgi:hypothetical protein
LLLLQLLRYEAPARESWEYNIVTPDDAVFVDVLDIMGRDRWELVATRRATSGDGAAARVAYECILRRRTSMPPASNEYRKAVAEYIRLDDLWRKRMAGDKDADRSPADVHLRLLDEAAVNIAEARAKE